MYFFSHFYLKFLKENIFLAIFWLKMSKNNAFSYILGLKLPKNHTILAKSTQLRRFRGLKVHFSGFFGLKIPKNWKFLYKIAVLGFKNTPFRCFWSEIDYKRTHLW